DQLSVRERPPALVRAGGSPDRGAPRSALALGEGSDLVGPPRRSPPRPPRRPRPPAPDAATPRGAPLRRLAIPPQHLKLDRNEVGCRRSSGGADGTVEDLRGSNRLPDDALARSTEWFSNHDEGAVRRRRTIGRSDGGSNRGAVDGHHVLSPHRIEGGRSANPLRDQDEGGPDRPGQYRPSSERRGDPSGVPATEPQPESDPLGIGLLL